MVLPALAFRRPDPAATEAFFGTAPFFLTAAFFAVADLAFGGVAANELVTLLPIGLAWLLWTWAGTNLLTGIVYGRPREDLTYHDLERRPLLAYAGAMLALAAGGLIANGVML